MQAKEGYYDAFKPLNKYSDCWPVMSWYTSARKWGFYLCMAQTFIPTTDRNNLRQISSVTPTFDPREAVEKVNRKLMEPSKGHLHALTYGGFRK